MLYEVTIALTLSATILVGLSHMLALVHQQRRSAEQRTLAIAEATNLVEDVMSRSWSELDPDDLEKFALSEFAQRRLTQAVLRVEAKPSHSDPDLQEFLVTIDWTDPKGKRVRPVTLLVWRHREKPQESTP